MHNGSMSRRTRLLVLLISTPLVAFVMVGAALTVLLRDYELQIVQRPLRWTSMVIGGMARPMGQFRIRATPVKVMNGHDRRVS